MAIRIIHGDILTLKQKDGFQTIAEQYNCTFTEGTAPSGTTPSGTAPSGTTPSGYQGLAKDTVKKYPYANFYSLPVRAPGTIHVVGSRRKKQRYIIALFSQLHPGEPNLKDDTLAMRHMWFRLCLEKVSKIKNLKSVTFPKGIGCGSARHKRLSFEEAWRDYFAILLEWAQSHPYIQVNIITQEKYKLDENNGFEKGWPGFKKILVDQGIIPPIEDFLTERNEYAEIFPPRSLIFNSFELCPFEQLKVIVIGQDPYPSPGAAHGLAFSHVPSRPKIQPSLRNIYACLKADGFTVSSVNGCLEQWAQQGVLLINTALTVEQGRPASHAHPLPTSTAESPICRNSDGVVAGPWVKFIEFLFKFIAASEKIKACAVIMWGKKAQEYGTFFNGEKFLKVCAPHPVAYSAHLRTEFINHKPFSRINKFLIDRHLSPVNWNLE